ncbi:hypothetical protein OROMI_005599 [Orobanche minor]
MGLIKFCKQRSESSGDFFRYNRRENLMEEREEHLSFLEGLKKANTLHFQFQRSNVVSSRRDELQIFPKEFQKYGDKWHIQGMDLGHVKHLSHSMLEEITNNFSNDNFVRKTRHGRIFRGVMNQDLVTRDVVVRTWDFFFPIKREYVWHAQRFSDEIKLLTNPDVASHPSLVDLIGYCCHKKLAVVYDFKLKDTVKDIICSDKIQLKQRIQVAIGIAQVLEYLHAKQIAHGCIEAANISVDEKFKIKLLEYDAHLDLGSENDAMEYKIATKSHKYLSPEIIGVYVAYPWKKEYAFPSDVHAYGVLLSELITKKEFKESEYLECVKPADIEYPEDCSDVERCLLDVAKDCVQNDFTLRPKMSGVVALLKDTYRFTTRKRKIYHT